jgi:hypothetical protein
VGESVQFPRKRAGVGVRQFEGRVALDDDEGRQLCFLNETAHALWELCDGSTSPREMVDAVRIACGLPQDVVELDVERTLNELTDAGLVSWGERHA